MRAFDIPLVVISIILAAVVLVAAAHRDSATKTAGIAQERAEDVTPVEASGDMPDGSTDAESVPVDGYDESCVLDLVRSRLASAGSRRSISDVAPYVHAAFDAADVHGVDASTVVAVGWVESTLKPLMGDQGRSCGPWQYQARYHPRGRTGKGRVDATCARLMRDPWFAAASAAARLARYDHVCHYNQGGRCLRADLREDAGTYTHKVESMRREIAASCWNG